MYTAGKHVGAKVIKANSSLTDQRFQVSNSTSVIDRVNKCLLKSVYASFRVRNAFKSRYFHKNFQVQGESQSFALSTWKQAESEGIIDQR